VAIPSCTRWVSEGSNIPHDTSDLQGGPPRPPRIRFGLTVGVTGHRVAALGEGAEADALAGRIAAMLGLLEEQARAVLACETALFAPDPPTFTLVSPLADGADQIAAEVALARGWALQAVLPFTVAETRAEQEPAAAARFDALLPRAQRILELPGLPDAAPAAYRMAGRATVAHADVVLAVWDGLPPRGAGGTAEVVEQALVLGLPVIHLPVGNGHAPDPLLIWAADDPAVVTHAANRSNGRPADGAAIAQVLTTLLAPPASPSERRFLARFLAERPYFVRLRIEYPLLMTLAGTRRMSLADLSAARGIRMTGEEWASYRDRCVGCHGVDAEIDRLESAYGWTDRLATHFAQTYRSSHVFNFALAALGAVIGLSGLIVSGWSMLSSAAEFLIVLAVVTNTLVGSRYCWHQRWLDYRQLAERLRPMRSLKLLGLAAPDPPGTPAEPVPVRWIDWYAAGMWRTIGCPAGRIAPGSERALASAIAAAEIAPQIGYHRGSAQQGERLDQRLEMVALTLFLMALALTASVFVGMIVAPHIVNGFGNTLTFFSAGLPAVGTAIFGIRVQGDFSRVSVRSRSTAGLLDRIVAEMDRVETLPRAADLMEQAGRVMVADLDEWRLVTELHELSVG
jgi:hypothetical protein